MKDNYPHPMEGSMENNGSKCKKENFRDRRRREKFTWESNDLVFDEPCCQCGFCCLSETCPVGQRVYKINKFDKCPALRFYEDGSGSVCLLVSTLGKEILGIGKGCCISARVIKNRKTVQFESLPKEIKFNIVKQIRKGKKKNG